MNNEYLGTTPTLESEPINIPDAKKCRANHGLITAIPCKDMTFGIFKRKNPTIKTFQNYINKE